MPLVWVNLKEFGRTFAGDGRTARLKRNVAYSVLIKLTSIFCSYILVPLTIDFVNPVQYGIWLTISSIVAWMSFFDVGFTNGLRNRLAEVFASSDTHKARVYVSTTYAVLGLIFGVLAVLLCLCVRQFDVCPLLRIESFYEADLKQALYILIVYFCLTFVLRILSVVLLADQRPALSSGIETVGQVLVLLLLLAVRSQVEGSLSVLALVLCLPPMLVWLVVSLYHFRGHYRFCAPSFSQVDFGCAGSLLGLGVKFFVIQIAAIIQFQTANILISRMFGMNEVTEYNIAYKYFNLLNMGFMIVLQPFWSAVTNAYALHDHDWIRRAVRKYRKLAFLTLLCGLVMLALSGWVYRWWIGDAVRVGWPVSCWMLVYFMTMVYGAIYVYFVNGIGALKIQYLSSLISPFLFFGLVLLFCRVFGMGIHAILIASVLANYNALILAPLQYYKIIIKQKRGIWIA